MLRAAHRDLRRERPTSKCRPCTLAVSRLKDARPVDEVCAQYRQDTEQLFKACYRFEAPFTSKASGSWNALMVFDSPPRAKASLEALVFRSAKLLAACESRAASRAMSKN